jgi:hypothetical protein
MAEGEIVEPDQPGLRLECRRAIAKRHVEQIVRPGIAWILPVHDGGRNADDADRTRLPRKLPRQRMGLVVAPGSLAGGLEVDEEMSLVDPHLVTRCRIVLKSRLAESGLAVVFPVVPGTDDVVPFQAVLAKRSTGVITDTGDNAKLAVEVGQRQTHPIDDERRNTIPAQFLDRTKVVPAWSHGFFSA